MTPVESPLSTDLYELNMVQAYLDRGEDKEAVFEFFVRRLPSRRSFRSALAALRTRSTIWKASAASGDRLAEIDRALPAGPARLSQPFSFHRRRARHSGRHRLLSGRAADPHHRAAAAGAAGGDAADQHLAFPDADCLESGPHGACGARKILSDFGLRTAHGAEAGLYSARASYIAGFAGAANVLAGERHGKARE